MKGRKRHLIVDHLGLMIGCAVGAANCTDRDGLRVMCHERYHKRKELPGKMYADFGYNGKNLKLDLRNYGVELETIGRRDKKHFEVEPKRWVVERTFAWLGKSRRLSKDYELVTRTSKAMIEACMSRLMLRRMSKL